MSGTAGSLSTLGPDRELVVLCDVQPAGTKVSFLRTITYAPSGGVSGVVDTTLDGTTPYVVTGTVAVCAEPDPVTVQVQHQLLAATQVWNPPASGLLAVTFNVLAGTATVVDVDGTSAANLPTGLSASWGVEHDAETLTGPQSITANAASQVYVQWTKRP